MQTALCLNNKRFTEIEFSKEKELEDLMFQNSKNLFGQHSIIIEAKRKIDHKTLGGTIPDAFLFDLLCSINQRLKNGSNTTKSIPLPPVSRSSITDRVLKLGACFNCISVGSMSLEAC